MTTLFELTQEELVSLLTALRPDLMAAKAIEIDDTPSMQSKVTEWLLLHNLPTLHKFEMNSDKKWVVPSRRVKKEEKKKHPYCEFSPAIVVNQPTAKEEPGFPYGGRFGSACCWKSDKGNDVIFPRGGHCSSVACCSSPPTWKTPLAWCTRQV